MQKFARFLLPKIPVSHFLYRTHILLLLAIVLRSAYSYTWLFEETPSQCGQITVTVAGSDATPPFRVLIVPFGPSSLPGGVDPRSVLDIPFSGSQNSVKFQLTYPENLQFVAVVSDGSGFASGGTSVATTVASSDDSSCFKATNATPDFFFYISTVTQIVQCQDLRIWWVPTTVQGSPNFLGLIPGGQSYVLPEGAITTFPTGMMGMGFSWLPNLSAGTTFLLVGGDARGNGTGGSVTYVIAEGEDDESCLSDTSPSSTAGNPAGGIATSTVAPGATGRPTSSHNAGAIIGGLVGSGVGLIVLATALTCCCVPSRRESAQSPVQTYQPYQPYHDGADAVHHYQPYQQFERSEPYSPPCHPPTPPPPPQPEQDGAAAVQQYQPYQSYGAPYYPPPPPPPPPEQDGSQGWSAPQDQDGALEVDNGAAGWNVAREMADARDVPGMGTDGGVVGGYTLRETGNDVSVAEASSPPWDGSGRIGAMGMGDFDVQDGADPAPE